MAEGERDGRERILAAVIELLSVEAVESITMRAVAERAGVGLGLINYHFGDKERLLHSAAERIIGADIKADWQALGNAEIDPRSRLRAYLRARGRLAARHPKLTALMLEHQLAHAPFDEARQLVPLVSEVLPASTRDLRLHLVAFLLTAATDLALIRPEAFQRYCRVNINDQDQREIMLDTLIDSLLPAQGSPQT